MAVLCFEKDGHRAIEYSSDAHCDDVVSAVGSQDTATTVSADCVDCVDIPLACSATAFSPKVFNQAKLAPIGACVISSLSLLTNFVPNHIQLREAFIELPASRSAYLGQRRTIVLQQ